MDNTGRFGYSAVPTAGSQWCMRVVDVDWYFDFVSPFSYLQLKYFDRLPAAVQVRFVPVLFAGLLEHHGHKGPAEIPLKRVHTYRYCHWYATRHGIPFTMPPAHPFNPLPLLREAIRLGCTRETVEIIFRGVFEQGLLPDDDAFWRWCSGASGGILAPSASFDDEVKAQLRANTEAAAAIGIYGVPSFVCHGQVFWGVDSTDLFLDFLHDSKQFDSAEYTRLASLPVSKSRR
ncbi:MAG: 2-hydroxychromene-2-carboxylate isomerase [Proteobacteria bacterium]|nr:MAG: 2-hydroxychromene-2-carboxylate isomerase [Pseudomonadota bacterium]